jgi:hypothetical protein
MTLIVARCPFFDEPTEVRSASGVVVVKRYQIVVWVSLSRAGQLSKRFPAILDTGHSHNFSMKDEHLLTWAGWQASNLPTIGRARINKQSVLLKDAKIAIYRNLPGSRDELQAAPPYLLDLPEGVAIHGNQDPFAPRLPLLGLRALVKNRLKLVVDGARREVSIDGE